MGSDTFLIFLSPLYKTLGKNILGSCNCSVYFFFVCVIAFRKVRTLSHTCGFRTAKDAEVGGLQIQRLSIIQTEVKASLDT